VKRLLVEAHSRLIERLTVQERPGKMAFRFWQEGPGYDRNLLSAKSVCDSMEYIHLNPVRRGLVKEASQWKWSSCRWYLSEGRQVDPDLPPIDRLPAEIWGP
jgi:putative transposase